MNLKRVLNLKQTSQDVINEIKLIITTIFEIEDFEIDSISFHEFTSTKISKMDTKTQIFSIKINKNHYGKEKRFTSKSHKKEFDKINEIIKHLFNLGEIPDFKSVVIKNNELLCYRKGN